MAASSGLQPEAGANPIPFQLSRTAANLLVRVYEVPALQRFEDLGDRLAGVEAFSDPLCLRWRVGGPLGGGASPAAKYLSGRGQ